MASDGSPPSLQVQLLIVATAFALPVCGSPASQELAGHHERAFIHQPGLYGGPSHLDARTVFGDKHPDSMVSNEDILNSANSANVANIVGQWTSGASSGTRFYWPPRQPALHMNGIPAVREGDDQRAVMTESESEQDSLLPINHAGNLADRQPGDPNTWSEDNPPPKPRDRAASMRPRQQVPSRAGAEGDDGVLSQSEIEDQPRVKQSRKWRGDRGYGLNPNGMSFPSERFAPPNVPRGHFLRGNAGSDSNVLSQPHLQFGGYADRSDNEGGWNSRVFEMTKEHTFDDSPPFSQQDKSFPSSGDRYSGQNEGDARDGILVGRNRAHSHFLGNGVPLGSDRDDAAHRDVQSDFGQAHPRAHYNEDGPGHIPQGEQAYRSEMERDTWGSNRVNVSAHALMFGDMSPAGSDTVSGTVIHKHIVINHHFHYPVKPPPSTRKPDVSATDLNSPVATTPSSEYLSAIPSLPSVEWNVMVSDGVPSSTPSLLQASSPAPNDVTVDSSSEGSDDLGSGDLEMYLGTNLTDSEDAEETTTTANEKSGGAVTKQVPAVGGDRASRGPWTTKRTDKQKAPRRGGEARVTGAGTSRRPAGPAGPARQTGSKKRCFYIVVENKIQKYKETACR